MKNISVAIDGPAGAGKSSVSRQVAQNLGFVYIDTGAMYRASALFAIRNNIEICEAALLPHLNEIMIDMKYENNRQRVLLNGEDVSAQIRETEVSLGASAIATIPAVRLKLVELQRALADRRNVVMDGRDIGTYVLPEADVKIYLTASIDERAKRRYAELLNKGTACHFDEVKRDIGARDENDMNRKFAPLRKAEDAVLVDSTELAFEEVVTIITSLVIEKTGIEREVRHVL